MDPPQIAWDISWKAGNTCLNRFCIDEDAAFELSGIYYLKKAGYNSPIEDQYILPNDKGTVDKGTEL